MQAQGELLKASHGGLISQIFLLNCWLICQSAAFPNCDWNLRLTELLVCLPLRLLVFLIALLDVGFSNVLLQIKSAPLAVNILIVMPFSALVELPYKLSGGKWRGEG